MSPASASYVLRPPRHPALDGARAVAVVAMVFGHTLDAVLSLEARALPAVQAYWGFRGVTAPLFLLVSGWAVVAALGSHPAAAQAMWMRRMRRGLLLLFLGFLLHWPGLAVARSLGWDERLWNGVFAFDALPCIGVAILVGSSALALTHRAASRTVLLLVLALGVPLVSATVWALAMGTPELVRNALGGAAGTKFPLFPWAGYFFAGALVAQLMRLLRPGGPQGIAALVLGLALLLTAHVLPADWSPTSAWMVLLRVGQGLVALGAAFLVPTVVSKRLAPLGRRSLWVYVLHIPVVYGWAGYDGLAQRVGQRLSLPVAIAVGLGLLAACFVVTVAAQRVKRALGGMQMAGSSSATVGMRVRG